MITSAGTIYSTEHGPRGGDELNVIVPGGNYGWPVTTFGTHYTTYDWPNHRAELSEQGFHRAALFVGSVDRRLQYHRDREFP